MKPATTSVPHDSQRAHPRIAFEPFPRTGPAAAAVLASGIGSFVLGLLSVLAAASPSVSDALTLSDRVGDVSGLTVASALAFLASWGALAVAWRRADPALARVLVATAVLIALGLIGTFPPFFNALAG